MGGPSQLAAALSPRRSAPKFWEKHPRAAGEAVAVPRECLEVIRVLVLREGGEALVRWGGGLGYDEVTWESVEWVRTNACDAMTRYEGGAFSTRALSRRRRLRRRILARF